LFKREDAVGVTTKNSMSQAGFDNRSRNPGREVLLKLNATSLNHLRRDATGHSDHKINNASK
jgi:hypothetical protein